MSLLLLAQVIKSFQLLSLPNVSISPIIINPLFALKLINLPS